MEPAVLFGPDSEVQDWCVVGVPARGKQPGEVETRFGDSVLLRSHTVVYAGNVIGHRFQTGHHVLLREDNQIGDDVSIGSSTVIEHHVTIGDGVRIHSMAFIPEFSVLEDGCWIGPKVCFTNAPHPRCPKVKECLKGPTIGKNAKIGANATLMPGIFVGENALVGGGAVVTRDVPANAVVAGNPAKVIKQIDKLTCPYDLIDHPYT